MQIPEVQQWVVGGKIFSYVWKKYHLEESLILRFWSDGCSGQFRSRFVFFLLLWIELEHTIFLYYNEHLHGKGSIDVVGGTIKHQVFRDVKSVKVSSAEHFEAHADAILNDIKLLYMLIDEVLEEPEDIEKSYLRIDGTSEVDKSWNSLKQGWINNHFIYSITKRIGIKMFVVTLSFPFAITLIKCVMSDMIFMPKIRRGWSAIYMINGFMKNVFCFMVFLKYCSRTIFTRFRWLSTFYSIFHEIFDTFVTDGQVFGFQFEIIS